MDHLRVLLVPFRTTSLIFIGVFALLFSILMQGIYGMIISVLVQGWVMKYCYVLIEHLADGATEPPVLSSEMVGPTDIRPWLQVGIMVLGVMACMALDGNARIALAVVLLALLPATIAVLGMDEPYYQVFNPVMLFRLIRGLGPYYLLILASILVYAVFLVLLARLNVWDIFWYAAILVCQISFFSLIGGCMYLRRHQLGIEPSRSPERTAAREEAERAKVRARMMDDVFQQVRVGKHVEATRPLASWFRDIDGPTAVRDAQYVVSQALGWDQVDSLNTIGSTLIRHLLRAGRPDAALATFETLRKRQPTLTLDSADDLRALADYAEGAGRAELARSMRLETPIHHARLPQKSK